VVGKGFYPQEDDALRDVIAAFERGSGKQVELGFYPQEERPEQLQAARSPGDSNLDNNQQFLARGAQRAERYALNSRHTQDRAVGEYYRNTATIEWALGRRGVSDRRLFSC
jgi:hypothetical protein